MTVVWYILIHVSLGLIGWNLFLFTNIGVLTAVAVSAGVQAWPMYEMYRLTWKNFDLMRSRMTGTERRRTETRSYWIRMARLYIFRISAFTLVTLFVAWLMRG